MTPRIVRTLEQQRIHFDYASAELLGRDRPAGCQRLDEAKIQWYRGHLVVLDAVRHLGVAADGGALAAFVDCLALDEPERTDWLRGMRAALRWLQGEDVQP
jgi:hypothetical protein